MNPIPVQTPLRSVAVDVSDPDLEADVRAVLAALSLEARSGHSSLADVLVTDGAGPGAGPGAGSGHGGGLGAGVGSARVIRVAADGTGVDDDEVLHLPAGTADLVGLLSTPVAASGSLVAVVGAVGGCGTSTVAAALAVRAAGSERVLLVEADPCGTGLDLLLGTEHEPGLRVEDVRSELGGPDPDALWSAVPTVVPGCGVLARARGRGVARAVDEGRGGARVGEARSGGDRGGASAGGAAIGATLSHRAAGGLVVCDVGGFAAGDPILGRADLVVVVTCADLRGAVAATDVADQIRGFLGGDRIHLVVRAHRGDPLHAADVAASAGPDRWDVLPEIGAVRRLCGAGDLGTSLASGRSGGLRRLTGLADTVLAGGGLR